MTAKTPWITIIGLGDDGLDGLSGARRADIDAADVLVGGVRHMDHVPDFSGARITWDKGFHPTFERIERDCRDKRVVILASGDPLYFGAGAALAAHFGMDDVIIHPAPGAFSLAAARMGWSVPDCERLTVHGRAVETVLGHLYPGARLLVLSADGQTPATVASLLAGAGFGKSRITVLEHLGGAQERRIDGLAGTWTVNRTADLNTLAIDCVADDDARAWSRVPGLPDHAFEHDGQLTKRAVRAVTLSSLAPFPGETLWDVGAGAGSVAIEWMRSQPHTRAVAFEKNPDRARRIERNARALGVPRLRVVEGNAPAIFDELGADAPTPDAVFVGGGVSDSLLTAAWDRLRPDGRLVANAVTTGGEAALLSFRARHGGDIMRLGVEHLETMAPGADAFRPSRQVLHFKGVKGA